MPGYLTPQELRNGSFDSGTLGKFANGGVGAPNINRLGDDVGNLATLKAEAMEAAAAAANLQTYLTKAAMFADTGQPVPTTGRVTNDSTLANNGDYVWNGTLWAWSEIQPASKTELALVASRVIEVKGETAAYVPLAVAGGRAVLWMEDGNLAAIGAAPRLVDAIMVGKIETLGDMAITPCIVAGGKVVAWFDRDGAFAVGKLAQPLVDSIKAGLTSLFNPRSIPLATDIPVATDGRTLFRARSRIATLKAGGSDKLKVAFVGDSWAAQTKIPLAVGDELRAGGLSKGGQGWISTLPGDQLPGSTMTRALWQGESVLGDNPVPTTYGTGMDGANIFTLGVTATLSITTQFTSFKIFYRNHGGTFRYRIDGGEWTSVIATSDASFGSVEISGATDETHTLDIDTTGNAGTVVITGFYATREGAGYELIKAGIGGASAANINLFTQYMQDYAAQITPDLLVIILGTNDYRRANGSVGAYKAAISATVAAYKAAVPDVGVLLVAPAISSTAVTSLVQFRTAMYELAIQNGWDFLNLYDLFGPYAQSNALGQWADTLHVSNAGARHIAGLMNSKFLGA